MSVRSDGQAGGPSSDDPDRRTEIAASLSAAEGRIAAACDLAGRSRASVTLIVVTKGRPAEDVRILADLGVRDVAENRDQEARAKVDACAGLGLRWHFVGQLQRNKVRSVAGYAALVHTVDRAGLAEALGAAARPAYAATGRRQPVLLQVSLDESPPDASFPGGPALAGRGGVGPGDVDALAAAVAAEASLELRGVMGVAPRGQDPRPGFDRLARIGADLRQRYPGADVISAGMSGDFEAAVAAGATHVRLGTAVLGQRPELR